MMKKIRQTGFTIVELLIVVVVIAILAAITIVAYNGISNRAKASAAQSAASQATKKVMTYAVTNADLYPPQASFVAATGLADGNGTTYQYTASSDQKTYCLTTTASGLSYYTTDQNPKPTAGVCFGHAANGGTVAVNLMPNPSFETNTSGWTYSSNITVSYPAAGALYGSRYYSGARTGTAAIGFYSPAFDVTAGEQYTSSMSARFPAGRQAFLRYKWLDSSGTEIGNVSNSAITGTGGWQTLSYTQTVPAGITGARIDIVMNTTAAAVGDALDIDGVMAVKGSTQYSYADGNTASWQWSGVQNNSTSSGPPQS